MSFGKLMSKLSLSMIIMYSLMNFSYSQNPPDSLVFFSDLKFHSDFERTAIHNFVINKKDTFNLFLAIDENMSSEAAAIYYNTYKKIFEDLSRKKIESKNITKKVKIIKSTLRGHFLKKYILNEYFPVMLRIGTFNCVTASVIYSLVFEKLKIPYKLMATTNHVYPVANPGEHSIVIETGDPEMEETFFLGEFKQQFINYLYSSKLIESEEYKDKSIEEIIVEQFSDVYEVKFHNLPGFQYHNKAITLMQNKNTYVTYELCQKAYFFSQDPQIKILLYNTLLSRIEKCDFSSVSDVDYLVQFLRFDNTDTNLVISIFNNIITQYLEYTDKEDYCEALFQRFTSQITNNQVLNEVRFNYYLQMSYLYQEEDQVEFFADQALKIKGNNQDALRMLANFIHRQLGHRNNPYDLLQSVKHFETKYNYSSIKALLHDYEMIAYLRIADEAFSQGQRETGEKYITLFEDNCRFPVNNFQLGNTIELTYFSIAVNYFYRNNNIDTAKVYANRGLRYLPTSKLLKSVIIY